MGGRDQLERIETGEDPLDVVSDEIDRDRIEPVLELRLLPRPVLVFDHAGTLSPRLDSPEPQRLP